MQNYQLLAAHNSACNGLFFQFQDCQKEYPFRKFLGYCNDAEQEMRKCIKEQRRINRDINQQSAKRRLNKLHAIQEEEKNKLII